MQSAIEFPRPHPEEGRAAAAPAIQKLDDLKKDNIIVKVKADNTIYVDEDKQPTPESELRAKLETLKRDRAAEDLMISAEETAYHQTVVSVVDAANMAGIPNIKMAAPTKAAKKAPTKKRTIKT
jgi:biopolymer transport protein ExbD